MSALTVAVDFDGVLHPYTDGWTGVVPADEPPAPGAADFLRGLRARGCTIIVHSGRASTPEGENAIRAWLEQHGMRSMVADVTCRKPLAVAYVDDRAVAHRGDFDESLLGVLSLIDAMHTKARR